MGRTFTLAEIRARARERADMTGTNTFITDAAFNQLIDAAYCELVDLLVDARIHQFESEQTLTSAGEASFALPADHMKTLGVDYLHAAGRYMGIPETMLGERNAFGPGYSWARGWRVIGGNLQFYPGTHAGQTYRHIYVPSPAKLVNDVQTVDGVNGWEELVVVMAAKKAKIREEADTSDLLREEGQLRERIEIAAAERTTPRRVVDVGNDLDAPQWGDGWAWR